MRLPASFVERVGRVFGNPGRLWLARLPDILARCRLRWSLSEGVVSPDMSMNYLEFATTDSGQAVALKIGVPHDELFTEMEALRLYSGRGCVRVLDTAPELGALLLKRLQPGTMLWKIGNNAEETRIAASVISAMSAERPDHHTLPSFSSWMEKAFHGVRSTPGFETRLPPDLLDHAEQAFRRIERSNSEDVLLHGDLHHENILWDEQTGWTAIDPKGVIGAPCLETGRFIQNKLPAGGNAGYREALVVERLRIFHAELGHPVEVIAAGALVDLVLSRCWSLEEEGGGEGWPESLELADLLRRILSGSLSV